MKRRTDPTQQPESIKIEVRRADGHRTVYVLEASEDVPLKAEAEMRRDPVEVPGEDLGFPSFRAFEPSPEIEFTVRVTCGKISIKRAESEEAA